MKPMTILLLYNLITFILITILLILCKKVIRKERTKDFILKFVSILVVIIHYSSLYVDYFTNNGEALIENNMILPVYPCNIIMWLLLIVSFMKNKESNVYKTLSEFTFVGGTICGLIGVLFNVNFLNNPNLGDYDIFKGLISHSVMIFGTVYLFVFNYVQLEVVRTTKSIFWGLVIFAICGFTINVLFAIFNIESVNAMYMLEPPLPALPFFNFFTIGFLGLILSFIGLNIYEHFTLPKEKRWLSKLILERER
jgi:hypothetical protein